MPDWPATTNRGFTLLELLVALAVFAIMATAAYSGLQSVLLTHARVESEAKRLAQLQMAFHILERDIEQAAPRGIRDEFGQPRPALEGGALNGNALVTFSRAGWDNPLGQGRSTLQRLSYRLQNTQLVRAHWNTLDRGGLNEARETPLLDHVQQASLRFLDDQNAWQSSWPPSGSDGEPTGLPRAVEISLTLNDWGEITRLFRLPGL
jgi:general secretion pathway protein J